MSVCTPVLPSPELLSYMHTWDRSRCEGNLIMTQQIKPTSTHHTGYCEKLFKPWFSNKCFGGKIKATSSPLAVCPPTVAPPSETVLTTGICCFQCRTHFRTTPTQRARSARPSRTPPHGPDVPSTTAKHVVMRSVCVGRLSTARFREGAMISTDRRLKNNLQCVVQLFYSGGFLLSSGDFFYFCKTAKPVSPSLNHCHTLKQPKVKKKRFYLILIFCLFNCYNSWISTMFCSSWSTQTAGIWRFYFSQRSGTSHSRMLNCTKRRNPSNISFMFRC